MSEAHQVLRQNLSPEITIIWYHLNDPQFAGFQLVGTYKNNKLVSTTYWHEQNVTLEQVQQYLNTNTSDQLMYGTIQIPMEI